MKDASKIGLAIGILSGVLVLTFFISNGNFDVIKSNNNTAAVVLSTNTDSKLIYGKFDSTDKKNLLNVSTSTKKFFGDYVSSKIITKAQTPTSNIDTKSISTLKVCSDTWTQKTDYGAGIASAVESAVGFSIGTKGYVGTGSDAGNNAHADFWEYDPALNIWTQKADYGGGKRSRAVGFSMNGKGYIGTGMTDSILPSSDFWEYDPSLNTWTRKADIPGNSIYPAWRHSAFGFVLGNYGYIGGGTVYPFTTGNGYTYFKDFYQYDPLSLTNGLDTNGNPKGAWISKADFLPRAEASSFSIGTKGYVGTGYDSSAVYKDFWEYDPSLNHWTQKANLTGSTRTAAVGFSIGQLGFISTGVDTSTSTPVYKKDLWEYNPATNHWTQRANYDTAIVGGGYGRSNSVGLSIGNYGYIVGGVLTGGIAYQDTMFSYCPYNNLLNTTKPIPTVGNGGIIQ